MENFKVKQVDGNWFNFSFVGKYTGQAKIFESGSVFGIGGGRISKLQVYTGKGLVFNYDRGLDFDELPGGVLSQILDNLHRTIKPEDIK